MTKPNDDLNQRITEVIKGQLIALLPEEDIRAKVDNVIDTYFAPRKNTYHPHNNMPSEFELVVVKILEERAKTIINSILESPGWKVSVNEKLEAVIGDSLQKLLGIKPDALSEITAKAAATNRAMNLAAIIRDSMYATGYNELGNHFHNYMANNARTL